ncbi:MAG: hypothetical protein HZA17_03575 [Nitrospirae bacterium]|nr:hypothetical protein [Nitrospirota bacterium]
MKKKRGRPRAKELCIYYIEIMEYELSYSVSVDHLKEINPDPISEHAELKIIGKLLSPSKVAGKIISVRIFGSRKTLYALQHPEEVTNDIDKIGELEIRGKHAEFIGFAPADMMSYLSSCLHAQKLRYIDLFSEPLHYGKAKVTSFHFSEKKDTDEET